MSFVRIAWSWLDVILGPLVAGLRSLCLIHSPLESKGRSDRLRFLREPRFWSHIAIYFAVFITSSFVLITECVIVFDLLPPSREVSQSLQPVEKYLIAVSNLLVVFVFLMGLAVGRYSLAQQGHQKGRWHAGVNDRSISGLRSAPTI